MNNSGLTQPCMKTFGLTTSQTTKCYFSLYLWNLLIA